MYIYIHGSWHIYWHAPTWIHDQPQLCNMCMWLLLYSVIRSA
jgi:hypothetical protein